MTSPRNPVDTAIQHAQLAHPLDPRNGKGQVLFYEHGQEYGTGSASAFVTHADLTVGIGAQSVTWKSAPVHVLNLADELTEVDGIPALLLNNQAPRLLSNPIPGEAHTAMFRRGKEVVTVRLIAIPIP